MGTQEKCSQCCVISDVGSDAGAKGAAGLPHHAGAGRGCCWMFLPSKETPEPGQALLLIQGEKTGSGEKQPVSF